MQRLSITISVTKAKRTKEEQPLTVRLVCERQTIAEVQPALIKSTLDLVTHHQRR